MPMPERDGFSLKRHLAPSFCLSMISAQTPSAFAKFYISCCRAAAARCSSVPPSGSVSAEVKTQMLLVYPAGAAPDRSASATDDRPQTVNVDVEPGPENVKHGVFRSGLKRKAHF
jgi:hypothetical protein